MKRWSTATGTGTTNITNTSTISIGTGKNRTSAFADDTHPRPFPGHPPPTSPPEIAIGWRLLARAVWAAPPLVRADSVSCEPRAGFTARAFRGNRERWAKEAFLRTIAHIAPTYALRLLVLYMLRRHVWLREPVRVLTKAPQACRWRQA
jgi:hypothetical protein